MREVNCSSDTKERFGEYNDVMVDETLLADTEPVEGLVLLRDISETISKNGTPILRMYCMGKHGGIIQCNYTTYRKTDTTSEDIVQFKNKIMYIKGITSQFKNMFIVDLQESPVEYTIDEIKPIDFFTPVENVVDELQYLNTTLNTLNTDEELSIFINKFLSLNLIYVLKNGILDNVISYRGDALVLVNTLCKNIESLCNNTDKKTKFETMWLSIVYIAIDEYLNDRLRVKASLLTNEYTHNIIEFNRILTTHKLLSDKQLKEFFNIYECFTTNKKPTTLTSKIIVNLLPALKESILATRLEMKVKSGNKINILGVEHIKL